MPKFLQITPKNVAGVGATLFMLGLIPWLAKQVPVLLDHAGTIALVGAAIGIGSGIIGALGEMIWPKAKTN